MKLNLREIQKLKLKKYRQELGYVFVEGEHLIQELEKSDFSNAEIIKTSKYKITSSKYHINEIEEKQFDKLSNVKNNQGVGAIISIDEFKKIKLYDRYLVFDRIQDPANLSNIIRQVAWFGNFTIVLSEGSVDPFNDKVLRGSMGGIFHVPILENVNLGDFLQTKKRIAILDMSGNSIKSHQFLEYDCYLFGNEANGVDIELKKTISSDLYTINGTNRIESLNLSSTVAIVLYEINT